MARFILPGNTYYGKGAMEKLRFLRGERAALICGGLQKNTGLIEKAQEHLKKAGLNVRVLHDNKASGQKQRIGNGEKSMREFRPDWIVALGDGNTISAAKAMWILYEHPWMQLERLSAEESFPMLREQTRFAALPAGFGLAADASPYCIIQDEELQLQLSLRHGALTPDIAILDPMLAWDVPFALAAYAGMDALNFTLEALLSDSATIFTNAFANQAATEMLHALSLSFSGNERAKEMVYYAQYLCGVAFANTGVGVGNALVFLLRAALSQYHIPRGCISAILMPLLLRKRSALQERLEGIRLFGQEKAENMSEQIAEKAQQLALTGGLPNNFKTLGIREKDYDAALPGIAKTIAGKYGRKGEAPVNYDLALQILQEAYSI